MKNIFLNYNPDQYKMSFLKMFKSILLLVCFITASQSNVQAQEYKYTRPSFWLGVGGGANINFHRGSTQKLNESFTSPVAFHNGNTVGLFLAPLLEYQGPGGIGFMLQVGYDSRRSIFEQETTVCNCPADLSTNLSYVTVEPSLRIAPFGPGFYLYAGPRLAFNVDKSFTYKLGINPAYPNQPATPDVEGDLSDIKNTLISMQVGAGYDIPLNSQNNRFQALLSPFVSFQPYFGQSPRSIETWNITTVRVGAALKFGLGTKNPVPYIETGIIVPPATSDVRFTVVSPKNIPTMRRVSETFPLRNYVFFDEGSTAIPDRYVLLNKSQTAEFKEEQLEQFSPKKLAGRSEREMTAYYNLLNIIGDRLAKNSSSAITLVGSSEKGSTEGKAMAESVKKYLTDVWNINGSRITAIGREEPLVPNLQPGGTKDLELLVDGDRRVSIETNSPALLMEFQTGKENLRPVSIIGIQEAPLDSYVSFNADGARKAYTSWRLELKDENNRVQNYGPYNIDQVRLPGKTILGTQPKGKYVATMVGTKANGNIERQNANVDMVLWTPPQNEMGMRYSVLYEFGESKAINIYEKYLHTVLVPKIPAGSTVIIHGHTDLIGEEAYNETLSLARANDVRAILEDGLKDAGRTDVNFVVHGMGEDTGAAPFDNSYPEERAYNRTVIIDIIPKK
ncbi:MAG: OmpA family protein [Saprospiraceae bacterium]|nr:OmpA family protein [Saprospiraceae bacterium]